MQNSALSCCVFNVDLHLRAQLLEIFHLLLVVTVLVVQLVITFPQLFPLVLCVFEVSAHFLKHLALVDFSLLALLSHQGLITDHVALQLLFSLQTLLGQLFSFVIALRGQILPLLVLFEDQLFKFFFVELEIELFLCYQLVSLLVKLSYPCQFLLVQLETVLGFLLGHQSDLVTRV